MWKDPSVRREAGTRVRNRRGGNAVIETAFLAPWIFFLFVGVFDFGFYAYAAICTQNAARAAVLAAAQSNMVGSALPQPCTMALNELNMLPNVGVNSGTCTGTPVNLTMTTLNGSSCPDQGLGNAVAFASAPFCIQSALTYQTIPLIPIPGILMGQMTLTRTAEMRILQ